MRLVIVTSFHNWQLLVNSAAYFISNYEVSSIEFACIGPPSLKDKVQTSFSEFINSESSKKPVYKKLRDCRSTNFRSYQMSELFQELEQLRAKDRKKVIFDVNPLPKEATLRYVARLLAMGFVHIHTLNTKTVFRGLIDENETVFYDENLYEVGHDFIFFMQRKDVVAQTFGLIVAILLAFGITLGGSYLSDYAAQKILMFLGAFGGLLALFLSGGFIFRYLWNR